MTMTVVITQMDSPPPPSAAVAAGIVAQPGGAAGATPLPAVENIVTGIAVNTAVILQVLPGQCQTVFNRCGTAAPLPVYPTDGTVIEGLGTAVPYQIPDGSEAVFTFNGTTKWVVSGSVIGQNPITGALLVTTMAPTDDFGISQNAGDRKIAAADALNALGLTIATVPSGIGFSGSSRWFVDEGGLSLVSETAGSFFAWLKTQLPSYKAAPVYVSGGTITLDGPTHNGHPVIALAPTTFVLPSNLANLGEGFRCTILNASTGDITLGVGIATSDDTGTIGPAGGCDVLVCTIAGVLTPYALVAASTAGGTPSATITLTQPAGTIVALGAFAIAGTYTGIAPAGVNYAFNGTSYSGATGFTAGSGVWTATAVAPSAGSRTMGVQEANDTSIVSAASAAFTVSSSGAAAGPVTSFAAGTPASTAIPLTWINGSPAGTSWTVTQRTPSGSGAFASSAGTFIATGGTVTGLAASTSYDFQVISTNGAGSSSAVTLTNITTAASSPAAGPVTSLAAGTPTSATIPLTWINGSPAGTSWTVTQRTPTGSGAFTASAGTFTATGGTVTGLAGSTGYDFQVVSTNGGGGSSAVTLTNVTTAAGAAGPVTSLAHGTATSTTVPLTWVNGSPAGTSWTVTQRTPTGSGAFSASAGTFTATGGTVTGLSASTGYDFQVVSTDGGGGSSAVTLTNVTTAAPVSAAFTALSVVPLAIGTVGAAQTFQVTFTSGETFGLPSSVTIDGGAVTPAGAVTTSATTGTFTVTGPALDGTNYAAHSMVVHGAGSSPQIASNATTLFLTATGTAPYNAYTSSPLPTTGTAGGGGIGVGFTYFGLKSGDTGNGAWIAGAVNDNSLYDPPPTWVTAHASLIGCFGLSAVVPNGPLPVANGVGDSMNGTGPGGSQHQFLPLDYVWASGSYRMMMLTPDGYVFVSPLTTVV
jgi:hypothetical protein